jgi:predicted O-linked N-acetylglucosamine transferase (SPINDLY family)
VQRESSELWFQAGADWLKQLHGRRVVEVISLDGETGRHRQSTVIFAKCGAEVHSLVVEPPESSGGIVSFPNVHERFGDPAAILRQFHGPIDLLFLDAWAVGTERYKERHRELYLAARDKLHAGSILLINDTDLDFCGKGERVIHAAEQDGFQIVHWGRQTLLARDAASFADSLSEVGLTPPQKATFEDGLRLHQAGYRWQAARIYERILDENPKHACAMHLLGLAAHEQGRHEEALQLIGQAIALEPLRAVFFSNYGAVLQALGRMPEAMGCFSHAVSLQRNCPNALSNLASAYERFGKLSRAEKLYREVLDYDPKHLITLHRLGNLSVKLGKYPDAIGYLERAITQAPRNASIHSDLGHALAAASRPQDAARAYRQAIGLGTQDARTHYMLGEALAFQDRFDEAAEALTHARRIAPDKSLWKLRSLLYCPTVFSSNQELDEYRANLDARLDELIADPPPAKPADLAHLGFAPPFSLAYQGRSDRPLKAKFAALAENWIKPAELSRRQGKPRIGFVVTRGHEGVFLRCMGQLIRGLNKREFDVYLFCSLASGRRIREALKDSRVKYGEFREDLRHARIVVEEAKCDALYFWEIGSDAMNYLLACYKLAPVQCTSWGTHVTSGLSRVDYYLSSELIETADADAFCTEKLWRMKTLPTVQQRLPLPPKTAKSYFGLPENRPLYLCFQTIQKLHPDQDLLFREVLRQDPDGLLAIKLGQHDRPNEILKERLSRTLGGMLDRVRFISWQSREDFHRLVTVADVLLDTHHFSAGTTCYDGFSYDQPFVTLPTQCNIGRYTLACYRKMGFESFVATSPEHYGELAVRLAQDSNFRQIALEAIRERSAVLFDDQQSVREHEDFFRTAVDRGRSN